MEDSGFDDSFEEDEEDGGERGSPPSQMLCWGVDDSLKNESRSSHRVDVSLEGLLRPLVF